MLEQLTRINCQINDMMKAGHGNAPEITSFDLIACVPPTLSGQLILYIVQQHRPPRQLNDLITNHCVKHYNRVKNRKQWLRKSKSLQEYDIKRMGEIAINSIVENKHITYRELAEKLCESPSTCQRNHEPVFDELYYFIISSLSASATGTIKRLKNKII